MAVQTESNCQKNPEMATQCDPSPRCVLEIPVSGTDSDHSSSSSTCSSGSSEKVVHDNNNNNNNNNNSNNHHKALISIDNKEWKQVLKKSVRRFSVIPLLTTYELKAGKNSKKKSRVQTSSDLLIDMNGMLMSKPSWRNFDPTELAAATDNYDPDNLLGEGGHAQVYRGRLADGRVVAVKKLAKIDKEQENHVSDFLSELGIIAHVNHPNAAKLLGFSIEGGLHLVLEYLPQGSLASVLYGEEECLDWKKRFKVATGIAEGLKYLHHDCPRRIIHRDIKASNILLTEEFEAQISDFGLAKWLPDNWIHHTVYPIEGTFGYLAPEYFMNGIVDEKTDVFAFGVLLLEIITGRRAVDSSKQSLAIWAKPLLEANNVKEVVDPRLEDKYDPSEMKRVILTASMCIHSIPSIRPYMNRVVQILNGDEAPTMEFTQKTNSGRAVLLDGCDLPDYTDSNYLNDLNRHRQLLME
ncbi:hypothetical protein K2173_014797 [Erythroxylum novogranatense]|uniref:non-specific serine/threonine protein kinase n=1 Tax=Erythroxylum novogranatense TaxID=1862640 RepID=A0AAV8TI10_9ROSI|nr:hypothetical protein K2173_014797 [Erythroxylum novogranatense]